MLSNSSSAGHFNKCLQFTFSVVAKDFDLTLSGGYVFKQYNTVPKFFNEYFWNNKGQIMIIKLPKSEFLQKQFIKELMFIDVFQIATLEL